MLIGVLEIKLVVHFQVTVEAVFTQKPSVAVKIFIIVVSLVLGLMILAALIWCLWKVGCSFTPSTNLCELDRLQSALVLRLISPRCTDLIYSTDERMKCLHQQLHVCLPLQAGFFKRNLKKQEEFNRDSWDYVPKLDRRKNST